MLIAPNHSAVTVPADLCVVTESRPELVAWLEKHHAAGVFLRPDRYVYALAADVAAMSAIAAQFAQFAGGHHESFPA